MATPQERERQRRFRAEQTRRGLVKRTVWATPEQAELIRRYITKASPDQLAQIRRFCEQLLLESQECPQASEPALMSAQEAAARLGVTAKTVCRWASEGQLTATKRAGQWRICAADVEAFQTQDGERAASPPEPTTGTTQELAAFADQVRALAQQLRPDSGNSRFISRVWLLAQGRGAFPDMPRELFNQKLMEAYHQNLLILARCDRVDAFDPRLVRNSTITGRQGIFHFLQA